MMWAGGMGSRTLVALRYGMMTAIVVVAGLAAAGLFLFTLSVLVNLMQGRG